MKKRALLMLAVCAVVFAAAPVFAADAVVTPAQCASLKGTWTMTYNGGATDTVTIDTTCSEASCYPSIAAKSFLTCWATGKKSDNTAVQFMAVSMDQSMIGYYEEPDITKLSASSQYDVIPNPASAPFNGCSFTVNNKANTRGTPLNKLKSGTKAGCATTTTTAAGGCPAQKVLGEDAAALDNLRAFRDGSLAQSAVGRVIIQIYYDNADSINAALDSSPALQSIAQSFFKAAAALSAN